MQLKRLEVIGFKSFGNKSIFVFDAPITGIVGPNGSGKSNIVEAIRFVLGEQSMKSLRGGSSSDLIFKSPNGKSLSRAAVSLVFDNSKREFSLSANGQNLSVDFDEVELSREVFADGSSSYKINGVVVRLKDILELIGSVNIGSSGHHIISQGEADRLLTASLRERKTMLEEALGLKVYHYRINESEKKLQKSRDHLREVSLLIRELEPHLKYLKKQVERLDQAESLRSDLLQKAGELHSGATLVFSEGWQNLQQKKETLKHEMQILTDKESGLAGQLLMTDSDVPHREQKELLQQELQRVAARENELIRASGKIEASIERLESEIARAKNQTRSAAASIPVSKVQPVVAKVTQLISGSKGKTSISEVIDSLTQIEKLLTSFEQELLLLAPADIDTSELQEQLQSARESFGQLESDSIAAHNEHQRIVNEIAELDARYTTSLAGRADTERELGIIRSNKAEITGQLNVIDRQEEELQMVMDQKKTLLAEITALAGDIPDTIPAPDGFILSEYLRTTERLKFKYEELGGGIGIEARLEYDQTVERHEFLNRESQDAHHACNELETLLADLSEKLEIEFATGLAKINTAFHTYFINMFGGGGAEVRLVEIKSRKKQVLDTDDEEAMVDIEPDSDEPIEYGVEVRVQLPRKRVQDLSMLSGGERSLTSIALLFALSQVNPPPFVVLDETDAALDEANSRKYGLMLRELSSSAELIVVTHNRETMAAAGQLFGVTIGSDGASQVLSVKLEEATQYAK